MEANSAVTWRKSSYSGNNGSNCVEVGNAAHLIAVLDSKVPDDPRLVFGREAWEAFAASLKADVYSGIS
jgi:hypothetical protein